MRVLHSVIIEVMADVSGDELDVEELERRKMEILNLLKMGQCGSLGNAEETFSSSLELGSGDLSGVRTPSPMESPVKCPITPTLKTSDPSNSLENSPYCFEKFGTGCFRRERRVSSDCDDLIPTEVDPFDSDLVGGNAPKRRCIGTVSSSFLEDSRAIKIEEETRLPPAENSSAGASRSSLCPLSASSGSNLKIEEVDASEGHVDAAQAMLEECLEQTVNGSSNMRAKRVPAHRRTDILEMLPTDWVEITHSCGVPVYLHKPSRVCTWSRPYYLGNGSARNHEVPLCAIPCLHEKKLNERLDEEQAKQKENGEEESRSVPTVQLKKDNEGLNANLSADSLFEYASSVFRIKTINVENFKKWSETRMRKRDRQDKLVERLVEAVNAEEDEDEEGGEKRNVLKNTLIITQPIAPISKAGKPGMKSVVINPMGKTAVNILHEYTQKMLRGTIMFDYWEVRSSSTPYGCTAKLKLSTEGRIAAATSVKEKLGVLKHLEKMNSGDPSENDELQVIGKGIGSSKKMAKSEAAKSALTVLIPGLVFNSDGIACSTEGDGNRGKLLEDAVSLFEQVSIEDERVFDMAMKACVPPPYAVLQETVHRNVAFAQMDIDLKTQLIGHKKIRCDMKVGEHQVSCVVTNKQAGKHQCAQMILKKLHSNLETYASLLRLYTDSITKQWDSVRAQKEVTSLQKKSVTANSAVLSKLREEMAKVAKAVIERPHICHTRTPPSQSQGCSFSDSKDLDRFVEANGVSNSAVM